MKINFSRALVFLTAIFILSVFLFSLNKVKIYDTQNLVGQNVGTFELKSINGEEIINEKLLKKNQYTLINFWASWCFPCRAEHKYLMKIKKNSKNLKILGVNFKDKEKDAKKFIKEFLSLQKNIFPQFATHNAFSIAFIEEFGNPYYFVAKDYDGRTSIDFGIYGIPESILIDENLRIIKKFIGPINNEDFNNILKLTK